MATDPRVSRKKFEREIQQFRDQQDQHAKTGIWMLHAEYPDVVVAFATPKSPQVFVPFAAHIDFTDYDAAPLSVTLVHPFTRRPLKLSEVLPQAIPNFQHNTPPRVARFKVDPMIGLVHDSILQGYDNDDPKPFLCMPGVKAYHRHPAHTGDSWWLHKGAEGAMHTILHALWKYGVRDIVGQNLVFQVVPAGYVVQPQIEQVAQMVLPLAAQAAPIGTPAEGGSQ